MFEAEGRLLEAHGHAVARLTRSNDAVNGMGRLRLAAATVWSRDGRAAVEAAARSHRADVVHFHNTLPLISPAGYYGAHAAGAAVVQTLHNYRLVCPAATLYRDGSVCEDCVGRAFAWPGVRYGCYRDSRAATLAVASMVSAHRALGTWSRAVDRYIALTQMARAKMVEGGLPADRVAVKYNALEHDPGVGPHDGGEAVFVGRLTREKGIRTLLRAWTETEGLPPLVVIGSGPEEAAVREAVAATEGRAVGRVTWTGWLGRDALYERLRRASMLVFPSEWYEGLSIVLLEALAAGLPVVAADLGAAAEVVGGGGAGVVVPPGDAAALARAVQDLAASDDTRHTLGARARASYEALFTPAHSYRRLVDVYRDALAERHAERT